MIGGLSGYGAGKLLGAGAKGVNDWAIKNPGVVEGAAKFVKNAAGAPTAGIDLRNLYHSLVIKA